ncbi:MAG: NAD(P)/FAD-dependent oxidoreductase, partial [Planctomycetota bacterium]
MSEPEREVLEVDVLFVGGGPASLAGAMHLSRLLKQENEQRAAAGQEELELECLLIDKASEIGFHAISGAVVDPRALKELWPDFETNDCPLESPVKGDEVWHLREKGKFKLPWTPPPLRNHGNYVTSLGKLVRWMVDQVE